MGGAIMEKDQAMFSADAKAAVDETLGELKHQFDNYDQLVEDARAATEAERSMGLWEALKRYPNAIGWSMLLSTAIIMEGFDLVLISSFYGLPEFVKAYGDVQPDGTYNISAAWQAGLSNGALVGEMFGLAMNGWLSDRIGYRKTMIISLIMMIAFIFVVFFSNGSKVVLLIGEILCGIPWGVFQTLTTAYASEVAPVPLRPYLTTYVNLCWVIGQLIASGVLRGVLSLEGQWAYRIPFALQWIWPVPILIGCFFAPESPWFLVRKGRLDEARKMINRLARHNSPADTEATLAMLVHTNAFEKAVSAGTSYLDCFKSKVDRRRTEIACLTWAIQNLCGSAFMGYSVYFLQSAGLPVERSFDLSIAQYGLGMLGVLVSWASFRFCGRRTLYKYGLLVLLCLLLVIGGLGFISNDNTSAQWAIGSMLLVYTFVYDFTVGPVCYAIVAEVSSTRLRPKTVVLARMVYNIFGVVNGIIVPRMLNETAWNWGAKSGLFWSGLCFCCLVYTYFRIPECARRTYGEIDQLFVAGVSARKFATTDVDQFGDHLVETPFRSKVSSRTDEKRDLEDMATVAHREQV